MTALMSNVTLVVLAGGAGSRMGGPKSRIALEGQFALVRLMERLVWTGPTILVTAPSDPLPPGAELFADKISDAVEGNGPLQGMFAALEQASTELQVFVPIDMPNLTRDILGELIDAFMPDASLRGLMCERTVAGKLVVEPFPCLLHQTMREKVAMRLAKGLRSLQGLVRADECGLYRANHWPMRAWTNLNTPDDLRGFHSQT